jgi:hypothetical protein
MMHQKEKWAHSRRNFVAMCSVISGMFLSGCKRDSDCGELGSDARDPICYVRGTQLLTPYGYRKIEDLQIGDTVLAIGGDLLRIQWIGRSLWRRSADEMWRAPVLPVRIQCGAIAPGTPHRDLLVSQNHRLCIDGLLILAKDLINGRSILLETCETETQLEYLHVKTERHETIFAEGVLSETLLLSPNCQDVFDNFMEFEQLYGTIGERCEAPCMPVHAERGRRSQLLSRFRSVVLPLVDRRTMFEIVRDKLESRSLNERSVA